MELTKTAFLLGLAALCSCSLMEHKGDNNHLFPDNTELNYEWRAEVRAGIHLPTHTASVFTLHGKVRVQHWPNATHMHLSYLFFDIYQGKMQHHKELHTTNLRMFPIMGDMAMELDSGFVIMLDSNGLAKSFVGEEKEMGFARNIKKSIAAIMQMDKKALSMKSKFFGFVTEEPSLYGMSDMDYTVVNHEDHIEVRKMHTMNNSAHLYETMVTNMEPVACDMPMEEALMHDSQRMYKIVLNKENQLVAKHIQASGGIFYYPFHAESDAQYIFVNQTFDLITSKPISDNLIEVKTPHEEHHLTFHALDKKANETDITKGRSQYFNYKKIIPIITELLANVWDYFNHDHLHTKSPDTKKGQAVNRLSHFIAEFELEQLEELHSSLKDLTHHEKNVFYHILPLVGTKPSTLMIKKLIMDKVVDDDHATEMLSHMFDNIYLPHIELVKEVEIFLDMPKKISELVRQTAALSFGTFLHKSVKFTHKIAKQTGDKTIIDKVDKIAAEYVKKCIKKLEENSSFEDKAFYFDTLFNIKVPAVVDHLMPMLKMETTKDCSSDCRKMVIIWAMWAMAPAMKMHPDPDMTFKVFWPILANREESVEMRASAYCYIMECRPNASQLTNIYWLMMMEPSKELYHFHYTYVESMMHSTEPCHKDFALRLRQLMKFTQPATHGVSSFNVNTFKDKKFGFSGGFTTSFFNANETHLITLSGHSQMFHMVSEDHVFFIQIYGFANHISDMTTLMMALMIPQISHSEFFVRISLMKHQQIKKSYFLTGSNIHRHFKKIYNLIFKEKFSMTKQFLHISHERFVKVMLPTDLGITAMWELLVPVVHKQTISLKKEVYPKEEIGNLDVEGTWAVWAHSHHGLKYYNPIADVWQSVGRFHAYDAVIPINMKISLNIPKKNLQVSWIKNSNAKKNIGGIRSHVKQLTYIPFDHNILIEPKHNYKKFEEVEEVDPEHNIHTLVDHDDLTTGHRWQFKVYDTNAHVTNGSYHHLWHVFHDPMTKNYKSVIGYLTTTHEYMMRYLVLMPAPGKRGYLFRFEPSTVYPVTEIDMSIVTLPELVPSVNTKKLSTRLTYAVKNKRESLKTWDMTASIDVNTAQNNVNMKMFFTRIIPGQKNYMVCIDSARNWSPKEVTGHMNIALSHNDENKCGDDSSVIAITMTGKKSKQQTMHSKNIDYHECTYTTPYAVREEFASMDCVVAKTTVRDYVYHVKTTKMHTEYKMMMMEMWDYVKAMFMPYYSFDDEHFDKIDENDVKIELHYPMQADEVDFKMTTNKHIHKLTSVPKKWVPFMQPDSLMFNNALLYFHEKGMVAHGVIEADKTIFDFHVNHEETPKEWTLYWVPESEKDMADKDKKNALWAKKVSDDKLALKVVVNGQILEATMGDDKTIHVTIDGQAITLHEDEISQKDLISVQMIDTEIVKGMVMMARYVDLFVGYDGHRVLIIIPEIEHKYYWYDIPEPHNIGKIISSGY